LCYWALKSGLTLAWQVPYQLSHASCFKLFFK
jgi:hypothetical protein